jgi:hypothetical protein
MPYQSIIRSCSAIHRDEDETEAYYGPDVDEEQLFNGDVSSNGIKQLRMALSS